MLAQRLVRLAEVAREDIAGPGDDLGWASFLAPGEVEECAAEVPPRSCSLTPDECVAIGAKPGVQLSLGDAQPPGSDGGIARERAAERGGDRRPGTIIERIALGGEEP